MTSASDGLIQTWDLTRSFGDSFALKPLTITVGPGEITGLLGPNGSGKSTLMRLLTGLVRPDSGRAQLDGVELRGDGTAVRKRVTYAPGELHLYGEMRAAEHLRWLLRGRGPAAVTRALATAGELGLPMEKRVRTYSHGMKRQLLFATTLAPDVRVRILDEPTDGLDPAKRGIVLDYIAEDARKGTTILLSSHHFGEIDRVCERLLFMNDGNMIADETAATVREKAGRLLRISWASDADLGDLERKLDLPMVSSMRLQGTQAALILEDEDPRAFLQAYAALDGLPAPLSLEHGHLSLPELYRGLYGVEGC